MRGTKGSAVMADETRTENQRVAFRKWLIAERDEYAALIAKGKGTWPQPDYVRDETWHHWQGALSVLESAVRRLPPDSASEPRNQQK